MKICVLGLDCAAPEIVFGDERLVNMRRLMDLGVYGRLESVVPPTAVPAWMCLATSQDPGSLGVYGVRSRLDHSYQTLGVVNSASIQQLSIWDQLASEGKKSILVGVPPTYPPREVNGVSIGCFLTPDPNKDEFTFPPTMKTKINDLVSGYVADVKGFRTERKDWLRDEIFAMSRKQWQAVHWLLKEQEWDYFHFVDIGLDRIHHGFWNFYDRQHVRYEADNRYEGVIPDYYAWLDEQIGMVMESLDEETALLVVSNHGAQRLDGGFAVNQWLIEQQLLVLDEPVTDVTPFDQLKVNWSKTRVWSEGGDCASVFLNVEGREPQGIVPVADYESFREQMKTQFESLVDAQGQPLKSLVFKPDRIYREVANVAPDLIVHFKDSYLRSVGSVGHPSLYVQENDTGPDACNHAQFGMFILVAPNNPLGGHYEGARLLDMAPTLLDLAGHEIPGSMQGRSLIAGLERPRPNDPNDDAERIIHERLAGLGYV